MKITCASEYIYAALWPMSQAARALTQKVQRRNNYGDDETCL